MRRLPICVRWWPLIIRRRSIVALEKVLKPRIFAPPDLLLNHKHVLDDLDVKSSDSIEKEADEFAQSTLIPPKIAQKLASSELSPEDVVRIAAEAEVHAAIVAGRWQRDHNDYRRFAKMLGRGEVRDRLLANS
jgi:hypothetical protein